MNLPKIINNFWLKYSLAPFYLLLVTLVIPLNFYLTNVNEAYFTVTFASLLLTALYMCVIYLILRIIFRNDHKSTLMSFIVILITFSHGHFKNIIGDFTILIGSLHFGVDKMLFTIWGLILVGSFVFLLVTKSKLIFVTKLLNVVIGAVVLINIYNLLIAAQQGRVSINETQLINHSDEIILNNDNQELPDIYHLVFDKYASNHVLIDQYSFDNSDIINYLENQNFYVASDSKANYPHTLYSLSTELNMNYADELAKDLNTDPTEVNGELNIIFPKFRDHLVGQLLTQAGYSYYHIGNWFYPTQTSNNATENFIFNSTKLNFNEYTNKFLQTTMLEPILSKYFILSEYDQQYEALVYGLDELESVINSKASPKFVFAHYLLPHAPYVYDKKCERISSYIKGYVYYLDAIQCANLKIQEVVDLIMAKSDRKAIIIIQSDEGPNATRQEMPGDDYTFKGVTEDTIRKRTEIQYAMYLPDQDYTKLYQTITPVNTYRIILNKVLNLNYPLLEDQTLITDKTNDMFEFNFIKVDPSVYQDK